MNNANDNQNNFMSYRECWSEFTPDQKKLMNATIQSSYYELAEAYNVVETGANECNYHTALFSADRLSTCDTGTFVFKALDSGRTTYRWKIINEMGNTEHFGDGDRILVWKANNPGSYTVILNTIEGSESITYTRTDYIRVSNCKTKIQSTNGNWYFGEYVGMNFSNTSPIIDNNPYLFQPNAINTSSSTICQSSADGRILFYGGSNGNNKFQLFNKEHLKLKDGDSAWMHKASETGVLCIPRPGANNGKHFYILTASFRYISGFPTDKYVGLRYSILDTSLDGGKGAIDLSNRNKTILPPTGYAKYHYPGNTTVWTNEAMIAIPKCGNLKEYWLIVQGIDSTGFGLSNKFFIYSVQSGGIFFSHLDSSSATSFSSNYSVASPDGRWIMNGGVLFTFDRYNGRLKQQKVIRTGDYGEPCVFSPNSKVLYYWDISKGELRQIDLTIEARPENKIKITNRPLRTMQMGPDGKIYIGNFGTNYLSIINYPNNLNTNFQPNACGFIEKGFYTKQNGKGGLYKSNLPNYIHAKPQTELMGEIITIKSSCKTVKLTTNLCCDDNFQWDYGDGTSTGSGLDVTHTYATNGVYIVTLTSNNFGTPRILKDTFRIGVDTGVVAISGSLLICDTTTNAVYSNPKFNSNIKYQWSAQNGTLKTANNLNIIDVRWNGNGTKKITLKATSYEGCTDSVSSIVLSKPQVLNNIISMKNKYCGQDTIFGTTPTGGNGVYKYRWLKKNVGTLGWNETDKYDTLVFLLPENITQPIEYYRRIYSNDNGLGQGCYYISNVIRITPFTDLNTIGENSSLCGIISIGSDLDSISGMSYQWERSTDGSTWIPVSGETGKHINNASSLGSFYYYRRKAYIGSCLNYSNTIMAGGNKVTVQPINITSCIPQFNNHKFKFTLANENDTSLSYKWEYKTPTMPSFVMNSSFNKPELTASEAYSMSDIVGTYFRCQIITACGTIWTSAARIIKTNAFDTILVQPNPTYTLNQGNNLNLVCKITRDSLQKYQWECSHNYGVNWFNMKERNSDTLKLQNVNYCQNNKKYRLKITNTCNNIYYSDTVNVKVNNLTNNNQDYWMKDQMLDSGVEKNTIPDWVVLSPDLFVANSIFITKPPILEAKTDYNETNYIHAMIRNRGTQTAQNGKLYLYWTLGATGEHWPLNWNDFRYQNYHFNPDSALNQFGGFYPMGGKINIDPIELPDINPNDSQIISHLWHNVPNPDWYYPITPRRKYNGKEANICILARIETCEESTYGMKFPEVVNTHENAANNNNIATRNLWVYYMIPEPRPYDTIRDGLFSGANDIFKAHIGSRPIFEGGLTWVKSMSDTSMLRDICFNVSNSDFLNKADVYFSVNNLLLDAWIAGGEISSGLQRIGSDVFRLTSVNACLENIMTDSGFSDGIITYFSYKNIDNRFNSNEKFNVSIAQYDDGELVEGSVVYELRDNPYVPPTIVESEVSLNACNWDESGGLAKYTILYPNIEHTVYDETAEDFISFNSNGIYELPEGEYTVTINDKAYNIIYRTTVTITSTSISNFNTHDTVWYDCEYPDSVQYVKSCQSGILYDRSEQVVYEDYANHYTLDPNEGFYNLVCVDSTNCTRTTTLLTFMDILEVPESTWNYLEGSYDRREDPCCYVHLDEIICEGESPQSSQQVEIYNLQSELVCVTNVETIGGSLGFRFCPPYWDTTSGGIDAWYSVVLKYGTCKFCRMDFMCDSTGEHEGYIVKKEIFIPSDKFNQNSNKAIDRKYANSGNVNTSTKNPMSLSIYPNPATNEFVLNVFNSIDSILNILIYDATGKPVYSNKFLTENNNLNTKVSLTDLASGVYTIYIPELNYYYKLVIIK